MVGVGVTTVMGVETQAALDLHLPPKNPVIGMMSLKHRNKIWNKVKDLFKTYVQVPSHGTKHQLLNSQAYSVSPMYSCEDPARGL